MHEVPLSVPEWVSGILNGDVSLTRSGSTPYLAGNVALRVPNAKIPLAVVQAAQIPITATSANLSGAAECTTAEAVQEQLQGRISLIVDGGRSASTSLTSWTRNEKAVARSAQSASSRK